MELILTQNNFSWYPETKKDINKQKLVNENIYFLAHYLILLYIKCSTQNRVIRKISYSSLIISFLRTILIQLPYIIILLFLELCEVLSALYTNTSGTEKESNDGILNECRENSRFQILLIFRKFNRTGLALQTILSMAVSKNI